MEQAHLQALHGLGEHFEDGDADPESRALVSSLCGQVFSQCEVVRACAEWAAAGCVADSPWAAAFQFRAAVDGQLLAWGDSAPTAVPPSFTVTVSTQQWSRQYGFEPAVTLDTTVECVRDASGSCALLTLAAAVCGDAARMGATLIGEVGAGAGRALRSLAAACGASVVTLSPRDTVDRATALLAAWFTRC